MEAKIIVQGKNDPPQLLNLQRPIADFSHNHSITFCIIEEGMSSGEPAVMIISESPQGSIVLETSLDKLLMAASGMISAAESRWGWKQPVGHATLMPPDRETRKAMLQALEKELREWDEAEEVVAEEGETCSCGDLKSRVPFVYCPVHGKMYYDEASDSPSQYIDLTHDEDEKDN